MYRLETRRKDDGSKRTLSVPCPELKAVQGSIYGCLIRRVSFPGYLHGGVYDPWNPRSNVSNARAHAGRDKVLKLDIADFFPSTAREQVWRVWQGFFDFSPEVAKLLTSLTTYRRALPQGAPTSAGLANLVFHDYEAYIVSALQGEGFYYTRYVDDITLSIDQPYKPRQLECGIAGVSGMLYRHGYMPKRQKLSIESAGMRQMVTGLVVNNGRVSLPKQYRRRVNRNVHRMLNTTQLQRSNLPYVRSWWRARNQAFYIRNFHPSKGRELLASLEMARPYLPEEISREVKSIVQEIRRMRQTSLDIDVEAYEESRRTALERVVGYSHLYPAEMKPFLRELRALQLSSSIAS